MFRNNLKIAWRNFMRGKVYSFINVIGLATGMSIAFVVGLWIWDEISFDHYHRNHSRLAQVMDSQTNDGETTTGMEVVVPLAEELRSKDAADFNKVALTSWNFGHILSVGDKKIAQSGIFAQPDLPEMLTLSMIKGSRVSFKDPSSMLIAQSVAEALFGDADPVNKTVRLDNRIELKVGGVYEDLPLSSSFHDVNYFLPWYNPAYGANQLTSDWNVHGFLLYVMLNDHADFNKITAKIKDIPQQHRVGVKEEIFLHPMDRWHLYSDIKNGKEAGGRIRFVWLFGIIGIFVLLLACINFMNLSTARSEKRAREVGIRKTAGSLRSQLIGQFLCESVLMAVLAFVCAMAIAEVSLPFFNDLSGKQMTIPWSNPLFWGTALGFTVITGLLSGSYPAFYLSAFDPIKVLKGTFRVGRFATAPRKFLVVLQFTVSITLIIGTIIVFRQIGYARNRPVGYTRDGLFSVVMSTPEIYAANYNSLRSDLIGTGAVENMAESSSAPTEVENTASGFDWKGKDPNVNPNFGTISVTHDFGRALHWEISAGRDFSRNFMTDSGAVILNESAVKLTGLKNPIGEIIRFNKQDLTVVGVVKDMVMQSPYTPVLPTIFFLNYKFVNFITVRINPNVPAEEALSKIEPVFRRYNPGSPFVYQFTDEVYARKFSDEQRMGNLATVFAVLAIFISCLGLFGLASFVAEQRTKEIAVRKVLGASVFNVWRMLSKEFITLVIISLLAATPIAYYLMYNWLLNYPYRTEIPWWVFLATGAGALTITIVTVSFQAIKAAITNPVKSLRSE
jgi:putative ABC transport system permease protein